MRSGGGKLGLIAISPLTPERMICLKEGKVVNNYFPGAISFEGRAYMPSPFYLMAIFRIVTPQTTGDESYE